MADKKKKQPSGDERRDSPRVPMTFLVRDVGLRDGEWEERHGDLSLGGISWRGKTAPHGTEVDVRFRLPLVPKEVRARGEILRVKAAGVGIDFHLRFTELDVRSELAIARFLDDWLERQK
ncbi:MAG: PilZ domain-containing protein [Archangium sp.]